MILVYPMLISESVSPNVLPGLIKTVEKYILLYETNDVLRIAGGTAAGRVISTGAGIVVGAAAGALANKVVDKILGEAGYTQSSTLKTSPKGSEKTTTTTKNVDIQMPKGGNIRTSLDIPRGDAVSLEPTWLTVNTANKGAQVLGVKVVPFKVKSSENIVNLLMQDAQMKTLNAMGAKYGRAMTRVLFRLIKKLPFVNGAISGDPKRDILYAGTDYGKNMFVCLSQLDLQQDDLLSTPAGVKRLHKLGWTSLIVTDDVNKKATFCMKEYGGICSVVPYSYMFASLGKDIHKAYDDLEDLKKSSGPFFNMKTNRKRLFSESKNHIMESYLKRIQ